jgi:hypothetical protein
LFGNLIRADWFISTTLMTLMTFTIQGVCEGVRKRSFPRLFLVRHLGEKRIVSA